MAAIALSENLQSIVAKEREAVAGRVTDLREQSKRLQELTEGLQAELEETLRLLRGMDEMLGIAPQLSLDAYAGDLRGVRLREIVVQVLRQRRSPGEEIHYREWYGLLQSEGLRVGGRDPMATFLTQISKAADIESVRPRSGLYRLTS